MSFLFRHQSGKDDVLAAFRGLLALMLNRWSKCEGFPATGVRQIK